MTTIVTTIAITGLVGSAAALLTGINLHSRRVKRQPDSMPRQPVDRSCLLLTIGPCGTIIDKALESLSSHDDLAACRNHRLGCETLCNIGKQIREFTGKGRVSYSRPAVYHCYMLEATEKIAEAARRITTTPGYVAPALYRSEMETIRHCLARLLGSASECVGADHSTAVLSAEIGRQKALIEDTIALHSGSMTREEYSEGSPAYFYLMLLYYLHSFVSSFAQVIKNIETNNHNLTTA